MKKNIYFGKKIYYLIMPCNRLVLAGYAHQDFRRSHATYRRRMRFFLQHYVKLLRRAPSVRVFTNKNSSKQIHTSSRTLVRDILDLFHDDEGVDCLRIYVAGGLRKSWTELAGVYDEDE